MQEMPVQFLGQEDPLDGQDTYSCILGLPWCSVDKESACDAGDLGLIPELGRSPGEGKGFSGVLAWRIPVAEETAGLQPIGSQRVRHD